ncbi:rho GTPase-activating protein gacZ-like [Octopus bimaculoides]|uniref:rho GTPase-activating protein gacZ-like n=1 Tax=Octopus bimaculoides TaxID=37653 RepID=UPI0022E7E26C|nr:rho GTPase-activating protein gacZ-like [Octopus bimaculoides]
MLRISSLNSATKPQSSVIPSLVTLDISSSSSSSSNNDSSNVSNNKNENNNRTNDNNNNGSFHIQMILKKRAGSVGLKPCPEIHMPPRQSAATPGSDSTASAAGATGATTTTTTSSGISGSSRDRVSSKNQNVAIYDVVNGDGVFYLQCVKSSNGTCDYLLLSPKLVEIVKIISDLDYCYLSTYICCSASLSDMTCD